jgi:hypothetical protein
MAVLSRRRFLQAAPAVAGVAPALATLSACSPASDPQSYESLAAGTWRPASLFGVDGPALIHELIRCATLAPSSHNTQCWRFRVHDRHLMVMPDLSRRCPVVDPDDHHVYVSLGCAVENLVLAAAAHGVRATPSFDSARQAVRVDLEPAAARASALFHAIPERQCTRGLYDARGLSAAELGLLEKAGTGGGVRLLLLTERPGMERVLAHVAQANSAQISDPAFVREIKSWMRFNGTQAALHRDGLFSMCSGHTSLPAWLGDLAFDWFYTEGAENDRMAAQMRSSAGVAVFFGEAEGRAHWVEVGRRYEQFALQATALGIRNAFLNQPVESAAARISFAAAFGLGGQRPELVVRFGRGPRMPPSLRRPVEAVMV